MKVMKGEVNVMVVPSNSRSVGFIFHRRCGNFRRQIEVFFISCCSCMTSVGLFSVVFFASVAPRRGRR